MPLAALLLATFVATPPAAPPAKPAPAPQGAAASAGGETRAADPWAPLRFLAGTWKSEGGGGKPGDAVGGGFTFAIELDGKVAVRRGRAEYAPPEGQATGTVHEDLTVIQPKGSGFEALYWDNEGHRIRYRVRSEAGTVIFESEPGPGPRFRLVYARRGADVVEIAFSIAAPGKEFRPYVTGLARRTRDPS